MKHYEMPVWTPEYLAEWVKERASGHQYDTGYGPVRCPLRWWEDAKSKEFLREKFPPNQGDKLCGMLGT